MIKCNKCKIEKHDNEIIKRIIPSYQIYEVVTEPKVINLCKYCNKDLDDKITMLMYDFCFGGYQK